MENITYLNVKFEDKNEAKFLGCKWDDKIKKWYIVNFHCNYEKVIFKFKDIKKEILKKFEINDKDNDNICPICYDYIDNKVILKCGHQFCMLCIVSNFKYNDFLECALCRKFILKI